MATRAQNAAWSLEDWQAEERRLLAMIDDGTSKLFSYTAADGASYDWLGWLGFVRESIKDYSGGLEQKLGGPFEIVSVARG